MTTKKSKKIQELENTIYAWKEAMLDPELSPLDRKDLTAIVKMLTIQLERLKRDTSE
jgi:hypothetical protein